MSKKHLSRLNAPKSWPIQRKGIKWIIRPNPGAHKLKDCIPLSILLKNILHYAKTTREVKAILNKGEILVDKKIRKDHKLPLGIMDVFEIPKTKEAYRIFINNKNKFILVKIKKEETNIKPYKIIDKKYLKNKKIQLNLYGGRNLILDKNDYNVGDSVIIDLTNNKIKSHLKLEKNSLVYLIGGKHKGNIGTIEKIEKPLGISGKTEIILKSGKDKLSTLKDYAFVISKDITLEENGK
ncbi:30S ribosomal protein S4e [archaeon]|nr:30S ribosomal protein S4e [archaeon]